MNQNRAQESFSSLARMLGVNKAKDGTQVNNNMQTLAMAKEQYGLIRQNQGPVASPKDKKFH